MVVFDNVVPKEELVAVRSWFLDQNSLFSYAPYDPDKSEEHDNVNWIVKMKEVKTLFTIRNQIGVMPKHGGIMLQFACLG